MDRYIYNSMYDIIRPCLRSAYCYCAIYVALQLYDIFGACIPRDQKFCDYFFR